eukprot:CAMPEP_0118636766 /NCGR_PEP_ID=MMETSP0785-20121206/2800_1 /TAXON_ID=91992 /ORGANISM="Bolidomonas pacifica, Strain CCMP 1866" /LENGTH=394 /DNA_ID=CAMNT_0006527919 /DNA_START=1395 /DNA_END=2582 /DNA_ORIENTATION=-
MNQGRELTLVYVDECGSNYTHSQEFKTKERCLVYWNEKPKLAGWYPACITEIDDNGLINVKYDDGDVEQGIPLIRLQLCNVPPIVNKATSKNKAARSSLSTSDCRVGKKKKKSYELGEGRSSRSELLSNIPKRKVGRPPKKKMKAAKSTEEMCSQKSVNSQYLGKKLEPRSYLGADKNGNSLNVLDKCLVQWKTRKLPAWVIDTRTRSNGRAVKREYCVWWVNEEHNWSWISESAIQLCTGDQSSNRGTWDYEVEVEEEEKVAANDSEESEESTTALSVSSRKSEASSLDINGVFDDEDDGDEEGKGESKKKGENESFMEGQQVWGKYYGRYHKGIIGKFLGSRRWNVLWDDGKTFSTLSANYIKKREDEEFVKDEEEEAKGVVNQIKHQERAP